MKKIFSIFGALLVGAMMFSCSNPYDEDITFGTEITTSVAALPEFAAENAEAQTFNVESNGEWAIIAPSWLEIAPRTGSAGTTTVSVKPTNNYMMVEKEDGTSVQELGYARECVIQIAGEQDYEVAVDADGDGEQDVDKDGEPVWDYLDAICEVAVKQAGDPDKVYTGPEKISVADFIAKADSKTPYELTGTITRIANTSYGNFDLTDETGTIYIYGLVDAEGEYCFSSTGAKLGDVITVQGTYTLYNTTHEIVNATYISHTEGAPMEIIPSSIGDFLEAANPTQLYELTGVVKNITGAEYGNFDLVDGSGSVYVYGLLTEEGGASKQFATLGVEEGDILTLVGNYATYNDAPQVGGAYHVSHIDVAAKTVTEFLAAEEGDDYYMVTGTVSGIAGAGEYGNIYLNDETNSIYVYGLLSGWNGAKKQFPALVEATGLKDGDTLTVIGKRTSYNDTPQVGSAFYFSHEAAAGGEEPEPEPVEPTEITIPELYAKAAEATGVISADVTYVLNVVVTGASQNSSYGSLYVMTKDATEAGNGFLLYNSSLEGKYNVGDELKVTLPAGVAKLDVYNGNAQVKDITAENIEVLSTGNVVNNIVVTADQLPNYLGMPVTVENASVAADGVWGNADSHTSHTFTAGGTDFTVYINKRAEAFHGVNYYAQTGNISGIAVTYKGSLQLAPRDTEDVKAFATAPEQGGDEPSEVTAYTMTLGVTAGEDGKFAPNSNISGLAKSFKEHTWTATDDSGKDTISFTGNVYYRDGDETVWYFNKKNPGTTVSAEGFGKVKKVTITLLGTGKRLPALLECKDKEGNVVASNETEKSLTMTYEFANATDGFTLTGKNDQNAEDSNYAQDLKVTSVVIEYEK